MRNDILYKNVTSGGYSNSYIHKNMKCGNIRKNIVKVKLGLTVILPLLCFAFNNITDEINIKIDFNKPEGKIRRLHGTNLGPPIINEYQEKEITKELKELDLPLIRLHDAP